MPQYINDYDTYSLEATTIENYPTHMILGVQRYKGAFLTSPREFCYLEQTQFGSDGSIELVVTSVDDPRAVISKDYVRARILIGGWILKPYKEGQTSATYVTMVDLAGKIPVFIQNTGAKDQALFVDVVAKAYAKRYFGKSK